MASLRPALLALLLVPAVAQADLGGRKGGFWGDVGAGLGVGWVPFLPGFGWTGAVGGWFGKYDDSMAIGRRVDIGLRVRQDVFVADYYDAADDVLLRTATMIEARRAIDLLFVSLRFGGGAGPLFVQEDVEDGKDGDVDVGGTVRAHGAVGWRFVPKAALMLRLEAGVDVVPYMGSTEVSAVLGLTVGLELILPGKRRGGADEADAG